MTGKTSKVSPTSAQAIHLERAARTQYREGKPSAPSGKEELGALRDTGN